MGMIRAILGGVNLQGWVGVIVAAALAGLLVIQTHKTHVAQANFEDTSRLYQAEKIAHQQTIINYQQAAETARQADAQNKARAEAEQRAVVERTKADYEARIARARADAQRLRDQLGQAHPRSPGTAPVSGDRGAGPAAPEAPADHGLSIDERLIATEQAIQLDALIDYVEGVLKVDLNGRQSAAPDHP